MEPAYPHTPAGAFSHPHRRELQVASALRNCTDLVIANLSCGTDGITGRAGADARLRPAAIGAAGDNPAEPPPRRPAKGSR